MTKASVAAIAAKTIKDDEAAHFGALAADWWDPNGSSGMLHKLNPVRLGFVRSAIDEHFEGDAKALKPLIGKSVLDVGCGAGLLCEPMARMGGAVTGVDAAPENISAAKTHMALSLLEIDYHAGELARQKLGKFDVVTAMEVVEHVADPKEFVAQLTARLKPGGLLIMSTPNRTAASRLFLVEAAERFGAIPRGTHHWDQFITPDELNGILDDAGLCVSVMQGIAFSPSKGLHLSDNMALNYILAAQFEG